MSEKWDDFDCALASSLSELPTPDDKTVQEMTPFRDAIWRICIGFIACTFTLEIAYLDVILPAVGMAQIYLGFRTLRKNNAWFRAAWYICIGKAVMQYAASALAATRLSLPFSRELSLLSIAGTILLFLLLHLGLSQAARETGHPLSRRPALWAAVWFCVLTAMALRSPGAGLLPLLLLIAAFACIIRALLRIPEELEGWGYAIRAAPVRWNASRFLWLYLGTLAALIVGLSLCSNHLPADAAPVPQTQSAEASVIRERLTGLGFPEDVLNMLPEEELQRLKGADACWTHRDYRWEYQGLVVDSTQVRIGPQTVRWYYAFWVDNERDVWQNRALALLDSYADVSSDLAAQILWKRGETRYAAAVSPLRESNISYFGDTYETMTARFSFPFRSEAHQGWMAFTAQYPEDAAGGSGEFSYCWEAYTRFYPYAPLAAQSVDTLSNSTIASFDFQKNS